MADRTRSQATSEDWKALHGLVLALSLIPLVFIKECLFVWPVPLIVPLGTYLLVVAVTPHLRHSFLWLRLGKVTRQNVILTGVIILLSSAVLVSCHLLLKPPLDHLDRYIPLDLVGTPIATAVIFCLVNALLEEAIFRGVLYQAMEARANWQMAILVTSLLFGLGHLGGYPPGVVGGALSGAYALGLGWIRHVSGGLLLPIIAHVFADATIFGIRIAVDLA